MGRPVLLALVLGTAVGFCGPCVLSAGADDGAHVAAKRTARRRPLTIRKISPRGGAKFVKLTARVKLVFSGPVDPATLTPETVSLRRLLGDPVETVVEIEGNGKTVFLTPRKPLEPGTDYEIRVTRGVARADGTRLRRDASAIFYTDNRFAPREYVRPDQFEDLTNTMNEGRAAHTATLLANGTVLLAGGEVDGNGALCVGGDQYLPGDASFRFTGPLHRPRAYHVAEPWQDGAVLIGGYAGPTVGATRVTEAFDGARFTPIDEMTEPRDFHASVRLKDGRILVTGGLSYVAGGVAYSDTAEILEINGTWRPTLSRPQRRRAGHTLTLLDDGRVLVVGGYPSAGGFGQSAEIFDPEDESFRFTANGPRDFRQLHTATPIDGGRLVVCADGGDPLVEVYDRASQTFLPANGSSFVNRVRATATALPNGLVLIAGGIEQRGADSILLQSMDVWVRDAGPTGRVFSTSLLFSEGRAAHTATTLADGDVLFAGGYGIDGINLNTAVLLTPDPEVEDTAESR